MRQVTADDTDGSGSGWLPDAEVTFLPPLTDPSSIYCAAANYHDHAKEMHSTADSGPPQNPMHFLTPPASLAGHRQPVARPSGCARFDWEVELAVIIGRDAADVNADDATDVIAGFAVANDLSMRDFARREDFPFFPDWLRAPATPGASTCRPVTSSWPRSRASGALKPLSDKEVNAGDSQ
ncbi:MAG TPA: fumarylacetoacetate hydrolase family protein [Pseudonocardiaceae bacterium]|jgi:2-keto-4-pentenoate hydratase/2-oxohepta-3-ene-1,7-dioic acid hydratase in catechol pathway